MPYFALGTFFKRSLGSALVGILALLSLTAHAGMISVNFGSTISVNGTQRAVEGQFILDTSFPLVAGFNDDAIFGASLNVDGLTIGDPILDSTFTTLFVRQIAPGVTGIALSAEDGPNFWFLDFFLSGPANPADLYDFLLSGVTEADLLGTADGALFEPFFSLFPYEGAIESLSVSVIGVPEPGSLALLAAGGLVLFARRKTA